MRRRRHSVVALTCALTCSAAIAGAVLPAQVGNAQESAAPSSPSASASASAAPHASPQTSPATSPRPSGEAPAASPTAAATAPSPQPSPESTLPPVVDATGLSGSGMVRAPRVALPGADSRGIATVGMFAAGRERAYLLAPARRVVPGQRPGLLIALTAAYTSVHTTYAAHGLDAFRDHGVTLVLPVPYGSNWNAGACCGRPWREGVNDSAAIAAMRDDALRRTGADPRRVALVGHSVGGLMAWRMACTPLFGAAVVVEVSGTLVHRCPAPLIRSPRMLSLHGALDATVPLDGTSRVVPLLGIAPPSVRVGVQTITTAAGCNFRGTGTIGVTTVSDWRGCASGGSVRLQVVRGQGHAWPALQATRRTAHFLAHTLGGVR